MLRGGREIAVEMLEQRAERRADLVADDDAVGDRLEDIEILDREKRRERTARATDLRAHDAPQAARVGEALRHERHERDAVDEREQRLARALEHLGEVPIRRHQRALDLARGRLRALFELALLEHVQRRAEEHVAPVEHLVEERVHRAEHAFVGEVLRPPRLHERLEVDRADEIGLDRALGELPSEDARLSRPLIDDPPEDRRRDAALRGPGGAGHQEVLARQEREGDLREEVLPFDEGASELAEEAAKPRRRGFDLGTRRGERHARAAYPARG